MHFIQWSDDGSSIFSIEALPTGVYLFSCREELNVRSILGQLARYLLITMLWWILNTTPTCSQFWADAGLPVDRPVTLGQLYSDPTTNDLYVTGSLIDNFGTNDQAFHYCVRKSGTWETSVPFNQVVRTAIVYNDTLIVGGEFSAVNGQQIYSIACLVDGVWMPYGSISGPVNRLKVIEGELYALGGFSTADNEICRGVAKRVNGQWRAVVPLNCSDCAVRDAVVYNGRLVVSGTITFDGSAYRHVVQLVDGVWIPVGDVGIYGGLSGGGPLAVYQGDLYLGGLIDIAAGNAGHSIMRWDGESWHPVGSGIQDETDAYIGSITTMDLQVRDGLLYVAGGFSFAGHVPAQRLATWDGYRWCSIGGDFGDFPVMSIAWQNDTLFAGCFNVADGQPVNYVAKFIAPEYEGNCSDPVGVRPVEVLPSLSIHPLGNHRFALHGAGASGMWRVYSSAGALVQRLELREGVAFDLSGPAAGLFILQHERGAQLRLVLPE